MKIKKLLLFKLGFCALFGLCFVFSGIFNMCSANFENRSNNVRKVRYVVKRSRSKEYGDKTDNCFFTFERDNEKFYLNINVEAEGYKKNEKGNDLKKDEFLRKHMSFFSKFIKSDAAIENEKIKFVFFRKPKNSEEENSNVDVFDEKLVKVLEGNLNFVGYDSSAGIAIFSAKIDLKELLEKCDENDDGEFLFSLKFYDEEINDDGLIAMVEGDSDCDFGFFKIKNLQIDGNIDVGHKLIEKSSEIE